MRPLLSFVFLIFTTVSYAAGDSILWITNKHTAYSLQYSEPDKPIIHQIENNLQNGISEIKKFFGNEFPSAMEVYIFPNRAGLNEQWRKDWNMPDFNSECWMVASGVAKRLDILSPQSWKQEACEHNGNDSNEVLQIITHELTHVYHAQFCANHTFDGMDDYAWLIEGLSTYVSGQLTWAKIQSVKEQLAAGKSPEVLVDFWKGEIRYQQAGSFVKYIDEKYGREKLFDLLKLTTLEEMMKTLGTTEKELVTGWKDFYK